ncbi:hypothetical protein VTH82DRAFT_2392, partial [Thermothelomyces myriococcoides]
RALGTAVFRRVWRVALERLNNTLWSDVLMSHKFTASGAAQFSRDLQAISALVERYIPDGSSALGSLSDALQLLNLPVDAPPEGEGEGEGGGGGGGMSLKRATDLVFTDNTEAKKVLDELDINTLTAANARQILQRRVENVE